jgi:site-specific DNA-methyltransferase (adenine-specific)
LLKRRIDAIQPELFDQQTFDVKSKSKSAPKVEFSVLVENGFLQPGQKLFFSKDTVSGLPPLNLMPNFARLMDLKGSIHKAGSHYMKGSPCNGWEHWYLQENGGLISLCK